MQQIKPVFREAGLNDLDTVMKLSHALFKYEQNKFPETPYKVGWSYTNESRKFYTKIIKNHLCVIAFVNKQIAGYIACEKIKDNSRKNKTYVEIINLYINKKYRKQGVGTGLMKYVENFYKTLGIADITVTALYLNNGALAFYQKEGYTPLEITSTKRFK